MSPSSAPSSSPFSRFLDRTVALLLRVLFTLAAMVFAASLLLVGLVAVAFMVLRSLLTGRKPAPVMVWRHYRQAAAQARHRTSGAPGAARAAEIVDVEARDITPVAGRLDGREPPR